MKRTLAVFAAFGLCVAAAKPAMAQGTTIGIGAGLTMPMSDWGDKNVIGDKTGFHFGVGGTFALGTAPVRLRIEGTYTQTSHQTGISGNTKLMGGMASIVYPFATAGKVKPYILAGLGFYNNKLSGGGSDTSKSSVAFGGGAGVRFPMRSASLFVEARYLTMKAFDITWAQLPITVGVSFPVGGAKK